MMHACSLSLPLLVVCLGQAHANIHLTAHLSQASDVLNRPDSFFGAQLSEKFAFVQKLNPLAFTAPGSLLDRSQKKHAADEVVPKHMERGSSTESVSGSIIINATPEECYAVASKYEDYTKWAKVSKVAVKERFQDGKGKLVELKCGLFGRSIGYTLRYKYHPDHMTWTCDKGLKNLLGEYHFKPAGDDKTKVTYKLNVDPGFYIPPVVKRASTRVVVGAALKGMKQYTELASTKAMLGGASSRRRHSEADKRISRDVLAVLAA